MTKSLSPMRPLDIALCFLLIGTSLALAWCGPPPATAQERDISDVLALARMCRHEAGFPAMRRGQWTFSDDCPAIYAVLTRVQRSLARARGGASLADAARAYSRGRAFDQARQDAACDVAWLDETGSEPGCWRAGVPWARRRGAWLALVEHARRIVSGEVAHQCSAAPHHWGCGEVQTARGCRDHERAARAGWERVSCGSSLNYFYRAPELDR